MNPIRSFLFIVLLVVSTIYPGPQRMAVAVNDLTGQGVASSDAAIITDRLRAEMINTGVFNVMERAEMQTILKEQGFQKSGACDDRSCAVEVGQILGVSRMVAGTVGRIGSIYTITLRMINVGTGEILFTVSEDCECPVEELLITSVAKSAVRLAGGAGRDAAAMSLRGKNGDVHFVTATPGAMVILDDDTLNGVTPLTVKGVAVGEHRAIALSGPYTGSAIFTLKEDDLETVNIPMQKGRGSFKVFSTPPGAAVFIDGVQAGISPMKAGDLPAGEHAIRVHLENFMTKILGVVVQPDRINTIETTLEPAAYLRIRTAPAYARILVNGNVFDAPSDSLVEIAPGKMIVSVSAAGYETRDDTFALKTAETKRVDIALESKYGVLKIRSVPTAADVFLNGQPAGKTLYGNDTLAPGRFAVMLCKPDYDTIIDSVAVEKGHITEKTYAMSSQLCTLWVTVNPTGSQVSLDSGRSFAAPYIHPSLVAGVHTLRIQNHFYNPVCTTFSLKKQERVNFAFTLHRSKEYADSVHAAKVRIGKTWQRSRQITFGMLGLAVSGFGMYMNSQVQGQVNEQNALYDSYLNATTGYEAYKVEHDKASVDIDRNVMYRNILYGVGGVLLAACGVSFVF